MRAGYVLHSLECLECGVMGKCCSNVLRSLIAYGVPLKAIRTCVCEKNDTAHVRRSRCDPIHTTESEIIYTRAYVHADIPNTNTCACLACIPTYPRSSAQRNSTYHAQTCPTTTHSCKQAMYCTHASVWSVELWASTAAMCCAPSAPMKFLSRLYAHVCVRRTIQRTCVEHDARSHTCNRERDHIHPCICVCRHTKYKHVCMPCMYTYLPSFQCTTQ
jgi:hypothetical protein